MNYVLPLGMVSQCLCFAFGTLGLSSILHVLLFSFSVGFSSAWYID